MLKLTLTAAIAATFIAATSALAQTPYYVDDARPDDTGNGLSWATAKKTIQAAVDLTVNGDTVWVTNGTYTVTSEITVNKGIALRSVNGPSDTVIRKTTDIRCLNVDHTDAVIDGFLIRRDAGTPWINGGGAYVNAGIITNCVLRDHIVGNNNGGQVYLATTNAVLTHSIVEGGIRAGGTIYGGSVYANGGRIFNCIVRNVDIASAGLGGGLYLTGGALARNCLISSNKHNGNGGGVYINDATSVVENCTMVGNTSNTGQGGGVYMNAGTVRNSIIVNNTAPANPATDNYRLGGSGILYSCTSPLPAGEGNTDGDPQFADPDAADYRLLPGSAAIDTGTNLAWMAGATDLDGRNRIIGPRVDMGAYEYEPGALACSFDADVRRGPGPLTVIFTAAVGGTYTPPLEYRWDMGDDGSIEYSGTDAAIITNTFDIGVYDIRLTVEDALGATATRLQNAYILSTPATNYVSPSGSHTAPYETWAKAANDIQSAIDAVDDGATVIVSNGTYTISSQINVEKRITLISVNGWTNTIVTKTTPIRSLYINHADAIVDGFTLTNANTTQIYDPVGFGAHIARGTLRNSRIENQLINRGTGAGVYLGSSDALLADCTVLHSGSKGTTVHGGGIFATTNSMVTRCVILNNYTTGAAGGGVYLTGGAVMRNCLVLNNTNANNNGGGIYIHDAASVAENCTILGNTAATGQGGGVYMNDGTVRNSILLDNTAPVNTSTDNYRLGGSGMVYSCSSPLPEGEGNTDGDPQFADAGGGDYRLLPGSAAIDTGTNLAWMAGATDLDGRNRIIGPRVDMGAYEYEPGALACSFDADVTRGIAPLTVIFTAAVGGTYTPPLEYRWDMGDDGSIDYSGTDAVVITNIFNVGVYDIRLTVEDALGATATRLRNAYILSTPATNYVSPSGSHTAPYETWAKAANDIHSAIDAVDDGATVIVSNGTYTISSQINVEKGITLISVNGWSNTIIRKTTVIRSLYINHADAIVDGFTLTNANTAQVWDPLGFGAHIARGTLRNSRIENQLINRGTGGGVYLGSSDALLADCTVLHSGSKGSTVHGGGVYATDGSMVTRCVILNNTTTATGGGGVYLTGGAVMRNSLVLNNTNANNNGGGIYIHDAASVAENCTILGNTAATGQGGGVYMNDGTVRNSILLDNTAPVNTSTDNYRLGGSGILYSCTTPLPAGEGNIDDDPQFVDAGGGDYRLPAESPCVNTGTNQDWMIGNTDLDGNPRIARRRVDMGVYELKSIRGTKFTFK